MSNLTQEDINLMKTEFGQVSFLKLMNAVNRIKNGILIDIGIYHGASSKIMIDSAIKNNNVIYAIDPIPSFNSDNQNYHYIKDDSVKIGEN